MKRLAFLAFGILLAGCTAPKGNVTVGGVIRYNHRTEIVQRMADEKLGTYGLLSRFGDWTPSKVDSILSLCRENGIKVAIHAILDRRNFGLLPERQDSIDEFIEVLRRYPDVIHDSRVEGELSGVMFTWPETSLRNGNACMPPVKTYAEADSFIRNRVRRQLAIADSIGLPRPFISTDYGDPANLLRNGVDLMDVELIYDHEFEKRYAAAVGACKAFGRETFGVDNAILWYGGENTDETWNNRCRSSWYHAYLRGANPIWAEDGIEGYGGLGRAHRDGDHPHVIRFRKILADFNAWVERHPRPEGLPRATVAFIQGRYDSSSGMWQTHKWGQRRNDDFLIGDDERSWRMVDECYNMEGWESRDRNGETNFSANPPLGMVNVLPYDTPDEVLAQYSTVIFLGFNSMDDALYSKLCRYVEGGGNLLMTARHLDSRNSPTEPFRPYNGGDWSALTGLRAITAGQPGKLAAAKKASPSGLYLKADGEYRTLAGIQKMRYGLKFTALPSCGWTLHQYGLKCDPFFTDSGFVMPVFENCGAVPIAVGSLNFVDTEHNLDEILLYEHRIGEGSVIFCPSLSSVGSPELYPLYSYFVRRALEAVDVYPKVESSDIVRWSCYDDGSVLILNTADNIAQQAIVHMAPGKTRRINLKPGELRIVK